MPILVQVTSPDIPMLLISHVKTTPWLHIVVKKVKQENASDTLRKLLYYCQKNTDIEFTHRSAGTGTPLWTVLKIRGACPLLAIAKSILELA